MKRVLSVLLVVICFLCLCGCYSSKPLAVSFENGTTSEMGVQELFDIRSTDRKTFDTISYVIGTNIIKDIKVDTMGTKAWNCPEPYYLQLFLRNDVKLIFNLNPNDKYYHPEDYKELLDRFNIGDKITFKAYTVYAFDKPLSFPVEPGNIVVH